MHRRAQWSVYRPGRSGLSTVIVNKLSHHVEEFWDAKKSLYLRALAVLEPQSCDVLTIGKHGITGCQWGLPVLVYPGRGDLEEPIAFSHAAENLREICTPLTFETPADLLVALIPGFPCVRPIKLRNRSFKRTET
jgi:hypothetical protein